MSTNDNEKSIIEIQEQLKEKENYIIHLEKLVNAYKNLADLYNKELLEADRMLQAQEIIQNLMREEKIEADRMIQAHESLGELTLIEKKETVKLLEAQENVSQLSMKELIQKDSTMQKILEINKNIGSILDLDLLLNKIVKSLMTSIKAERGMLFIREKNKLVPKIFINNENKKFDNEYFNYCQNIILDCAHALSSKLKINDTLKYNETELNISSLAVPLVYKDNLLGVLYTDIISSEEAFKTNDLFSAEIFAGLAAISINSSLLYQSIKKQNRELLKLVNLKNEFITRLSDHLLKPVSKAKSELEKLISVKDSVNEEQALMMESLNKKIDQIENIVQKTLSLGEMESSVNELFKDTIDIRDFIENKILLNYQKAIKEKNLNISIILPDEFRHFTANKAMLRVILDELLSNAVLYNKQNGSINVLGNIKEHLLTIDITDTGYGIPEKDLDKIFQQFYRTEEGARYNESGAGLGLFMVKNSLAYYGGDIKVRSTHGEGSTFTISFLAH